MMEMKVTQAVMLTHGIRTLLRTLPLYIVPSIVNTPHHSGGLSNPTPIEQIIIVHIKCTLLKSFLFQNHPTENGGPKSDLLEQYWS